MFDQPSFFDFQFRYLSFLEVRCVGALLKYVEKKRLGVELEEEGVRIPILAVKHFSL